MSALGALMGGGSTGGSGGTTGLLASLTPMAAQASGFNGTAYPGTGIGPFIAWARAQNLIQPATIGAVIQSLPGIFGGYPFPTNTGAEKGPAALFVAVFAILGLANMYVFLRNLKRGHGFFFSFGVAVFCLMKVIGFALRIAWNNDVTRINIGICNVVFTQVAPLILLTMNMILAHRIFTWRHPETGISWPVVWFINQVYFLVFVIILMAIVGETLPYVYYLSEYHYHICRNVTKAAAFFNMIYTLLPFQFIGMAYALKPGTIVPHPFQKKYPNGLPPVFQASWITSASLGYFVPKGSQHIVYKNEPAAEAVRIMPSREPPGKGDHRVHGQPMHPDSPRLSHALMIVLFTSFVFLLNTVIRMAATFRSYPRYGTLRADGSIDVIFWPWHPYVHYIFYGATEAIAIVAFLVGRVDLRFYLPDMPKAAKKNPNGSAPITETYEDLGKYDEAKQVDTESASVERY